MNLIELEKEIEKNFVIGAFREGVIDALIHGQRNDTNSHHYYNEGYDFGLFLTNELNIQGACFL